MNDIRSTQRNIAKMPVAEAEERMHKAAENLSMAIAMRSEPDTAAADLMIAVIALADALGVDLQTLVDQRMARRGMLLTLIGRTQ